MPKRRLLWQLFPSYLRHHAGGADRRRLVRASTRSKRSIAIGVRERSGKRRRSSLPTSIGRRIPRQPDRRSCWPMLCTRYAPATGVRVVVLLADGQRCVCDSEAPAGRARSWHEPPEIRAGAGRPDRQRRRATARRPSSASCTWPCRSSAAGEVVGVVHAVDAARRGRSGSPACSRHQSARWLGRRWVWRWLGVGIRWRLAAHQPAAGRNAPRRRAFCPRRAGLQAARARVRRTGRPGRSAQPDGRAAAGADQHHRAAEQRAAGRAVEHGRRRAGRRQPAARDQPEQGHRPAAGHRPGTGPGPQPAGGDSQRRPAAIRQPRAASATSRSTTT